MKRTVLFLLALIMLFSLIGCSEQDISSKENEAEEDQIILITPEEYTANVRENVVDLISGLATERFIDVTYSEVEKVSYYSETCKRKRSFNIMLPANYDKNKKYPVLYILHGYWGTEDSMSHDSGLKLPEIICNAIGKGEAEEMIVVFPYLYASDKNDALTEFGTEANAAYDNFINDLVNDLMPYIEKHYSVKTGRMNTAITGFSMGGRESIYIGFARPDLFGYVGAVCPAPGVTADLIPESELVFGEEKPYLFFITAGSNDGVVGETPAGYHDIFTRNGVDHVWQYIKGGDHGSMSIKPHIYNFVRNIFKAK